MGKKASPTLIGAFVVGALALAVLGVLAFGSGQMFKQTSKFVAYFPGSVNGLTIGSPVKFKGVDIGQVTDIRLSFDKTADDEKLTIPVYFETDPSKVTVDGRVIHLHDPATMKRMVEEGLRAQLQQQSLVTGLLFVQLDFLPDTPVRYVQPRPSEYTEVPATPTTLEQAQTAARELVDELRKIKFGEVIQEASAALKGINDLVNSAGVRDAVAALPGTMENLNDTVTSLRRLADDARGQVGPLADGLEKAVAQAEATLKGVDGVMGNAGALIEPGAPLDYDLRQVLRDVSAAARSVQALADFLERNPGALLRGRAPGGETSP
jgi:paraquat-inducible protein B